MFAPHSRPSTEALLSYRRRSYLLGEGHEPRPSAVTSPRLGLSRARRLSMAHNSALVLAPGPSSSSCEVLRPRVFLSPSAEHLLSSKRFILIRAPWGTALGKDVEPAALSPSPSPKSSAAASSVASQLLDYFLEETPLARAELKAGRRRLAALAASASTLPAERRAGAELAASQQPPAPLPPRHREGASRESGSSYGSSLMRRGGVLSPPLYRLLRVETAQARTRGGRWEEPRMAGRAGGAKKSRGWAWGASAQGASAKGASAQGASALGSAAPAHGRPLNMTRVASRSNGPRVSVWR
jgi:hypothetical protein